MRPWAKAPSGSGRGTAQWRPLAALALAMCAAIAAVALARAPQTWADAAAFVLLAAAVGLLGWLWAWLRGTAEALERLAEATADNGQPTAGALDEAGLPGPLRPLVRAVARLKSEKRALQAARRAANEKLAALVGAVPVGMLLVSADGAVRLANPPARRILQMDEQPGAQATYGDLGAWSVELADLAAKARETGVRQDAEIRVGSGREVLASAFVAKPGGEVWVVMQDITRLKQMEQVRRDFVANAGHEMRTPAAAIRVLADNLLSGAMADPQMGPKFLRDIIANTERLERLIADMLALARFEETAEALEDVDVTAVIQKAAAGARALVEAASMTLQVHTQQAGLRARCVSEALETALVNLIDNAVKYASDGGLVEVEAWREGDQVQIAVRDHGPGIPKHLRQRVFERFYRIDKARSRELGGTGLGLSIVRHAVEQSGGRVWIEETPGGGVTFMIALPAA